MDSIFTRKDGRNYTQGGEQQSLLRPENPPSNNDFLILTRLLQIANRVPQNPFQNQDWDNYQPGHTCDQDCLIFHTFHPLPKFLSCLNL
jgi:hypothetical protein